MGGESSVITKVRNDVFGSFIINQLNNYNVNTEGIICCYQSYRNIIIFIVREASVAEYITYDDDCAETHIQVSDIDYGQIDKYDILHFSSRALVTPIKNTLDELIKYAKKA